MSNHSRNLGRGLTALISSGLLHRLAPTAEATPPRTLPLTVIQAGPSQPRLMMDPQPLEGRQTRCLDRHPCRGARAFLGLGDDAERVRLARWVAERNLSVRATEADPPDAGREGQGAGDASRIVGRERSLEDPRRWGPVTAEVRRQRQIDRRVCGYECAGRDRRGGQGCYFVLGMHFQEGRSQVGQHPSTLGRQIEGARSPFIRYPGNATERKAGSTGGCHV
jgi:hypothetical protein